MKRTNKVVALVLCVILAMGCMTGCGKKSDEEILLSSVSVLNKAKSFEADTTLAGKMSMKFQEESQDMDMKMSMKQVQFNEPLKAKVTMDMEMLGQKTSVECYVQKDGDKYASYVGTGGAWQKVVMDNLDEAMKSSGMDMTAQFAEDASKYTKKEDKTEGEKTYLTYEYTISGDEMKGVVAGLMSSMGSALPAEDSKKIEDTISEAIGSLSYVLWIDRESETIYRAECSMAAMMENLLKVVFKSMGESQDSDSMGVAEAMSQIDISVPEMNMVMTYKNMDKATDFDIPKEALEAKEAATDK